MRPLDPPYTLRRREDGARRRRAYDRWSAERRAPLAGYLHAEIERFVKLQVPEGARVLQVGCGDGDLLAALRPSFGVGLDFSRAMLERARRSHPDLVLVEADAEELPLRGGFDYVVFADVLGDLVNVWPALRGLASVLRPGSRLVIVYYNFLWEPILKLSERLGLKRPQLYQNWLALEDISNLLHLNGLEVVGQGYRVLMPLGVPFLAGLCNRFLATLPLLRKLCLLN